MSWKLERVSEKLRSFRALDRRLAIGFDEEEEPLDPGMKHEGNGRDGDPGESPFHEMCLRKLEFLAKLYERQNGNLARREGPLAEMCLIEMRDWRSFREISRRGSDGLLPRFAFDGEEGLSVSQHDEIDFALVRIPQVAKLHGIAFRVLDPVTVL